MDNLNFELNMEFINALFSSDNIELIIYIYITKIMLIYSFIKLANAQEELNPKEKVLPKKEWLNLLLPLWGEVYLFVLAFKHSKTFWKLNDEYGGFGFGIINLGFYKTKLILYALSVITYFISLYLGSLTIGYYSQSLIVLSTIWTFLSNKQLEKAKIRMI